ncbi:hypothetical protein SB816_02925 [Achromobacter sp. SIMBA_011]|uniref:hypothetical protein n=1 Tax=Achromobacter TaxID=222 RepID=UPI00300CDC29
MKISGENDQGRLVHAVHIEGFHLPGAGVIVAKGWLRICVLMVNLDLEQNYVFLSACHICKE